MAETFQVGNKFGGFRLVAKIATGEFGETWLCENDITKRKAVLKGLKKDIFMSAGELVKEFDIVARTKEEAQIVATLDDYRFPFVPAVYDVVEIPDGRVFFLTKFIDGAMLKDWLQNDQISIETRLSVAF